MIFDMSVVGDRRASERFEGIAERAGDLRPVLRGDVADYLRQRESTMFSTAGGGAWPPTGPDGTRKKGHSRPLIDTGRLQDSLTKKGVRGSVSRATRTQLKFGTSLFYARFQHKMDRRPVERTMIGEDEVADILTDYIVRGEGGMFNLPGGGA